MPTYIVTVDQTKVWEVRIVADDKTEARHLAEAQFLGNGWDDEPDYISDFVATNVEEVEK